MSATRKISGVDCGPQCFAHVGDADDNKTFRLCLRVPGDTGKTINAVKSSLFRFHTMQDLPTGQRSALWNRLVGAAICLGVAVVKDPIVVATDDEISQILAERRANDLVSRISMEWGK
jgi:hypothetical protein